MEIGRGGSLQRRPTGRNQRGGVEGVYDGDPHCDLHGHVPPKVSTASASSGPKGKSADSQPIPRVLIHFGKSANCRTRVSSSSPGTLQVPLTGCTNRAISRTVCAGQKQLRSSENSDAPYSQSRTLKMPENVLVADTGSPPEK